MSEEPRDNPDTRDSPGDDGEVPTYDPDVTTTGAYGETRTALEPSVVTAPGVDPLEHRDQGSYYNPITGAYGEHFDYPTAAGVHHHRERTGATGVYRERDVDIRDDGSKHVHRVYDNPNTGTRVERDYEVEEYEI
ncbi:hypothetical protein IMZ48_25755 [Candidatus Bathyarchaeota archaeon]|nr:hypothetical protein [Candidatus Bathyarchaeota archaeon]